MNPPFERRRFLTAQNSIYHDSQHASYVILPLVPAR